MFCACFLQPAARAQQPKLVVPVGHTWGITQSIFSHDGKLLATAAKDNTIKLWHTATGRLLNTLYGHKSIIGDLQFSSKSNYLVSNAQGEAISRIWRVKDGLELLRVTNTIYRGDQIKISDDERYALELAQQNIILSDLATGKTTDSFHLDKSNGEPYIFSQCAISPDSRLIAGYDNGSNLLIIWNRASRSLQKKIPLDIGYGMKSISFSADNKRVYCISSVNLQVLDLQSGRTLFTSDNYRNSLADPVITGNGRWFFTGGYEQYYKVVNNDTMENNDPQGRYFYQPTLTDLRTFQRIRLQGERPPGFLHKLLIDPTARWMLAMCEDSLFIYRIEQNKLLKQAVIHADQLAYSSTFNGTDISAGGEYIVCTSREDDPVLFNNKGKKLSRLAGSIVYDTVQYFSNDGNYIFTGTGNQKKFSWDIQNGKLSAVYDSIAATRTENGPVNTHKYIVYDSADQQWKIGDKDSRVALKGEKARSLRGTPSNNNKYVVSYAGNDSLAKVWDSETGNLLYQVQSRYGEFSHPVFSSDDRFMALIVSNASAQLDLMWASLQRELDGDTAAAANTAVAPNEIRVLDLATGRQLFYLQDTSGFLYFTSMRFSEKANHFSIGTGYFRIWETRNWKQLLSVSSNCNYDSPGWATNSDESLLLLSCENSSSLYETGTNRLLYELPGAVSFGSFSKDDKRILTEAPDRQLKIWDTHSGKLLYTYHAFSNGNYIVTDAFDRYDGTEEARKKLYYSCGNEFIDLEQFKDQLWVPGLAERIMQGDSINAPRLSDLNICGLTPEVRDESKGSVSYRFIITPRRGGLGETIVYVNGIEARRFIKAMLKKISGGYELTLTREELRSFFITGKENLVTVKAFTADNTISSRGVIITETGKPVNTAKPNLYAVMIGVSDYKGDELDLKLAAGDAIAMSSVIRSASGKFLNTDSSNHVFIYELTTSPNRYLMPEKNSIRKTLEEIGRKATPNDILLVFFAGHGLMAGESGRKQFYFLTADASSLSASATAGISTAELAEWMKPQLIKAQKRILILDACNSGQAINDLVQIGKENQGYTAARNDDRSQLIKAIDKLNERSGLFILAASASNQNAYESGLLNHGVLTHALLKAVKLQPDILEENMYLNVSRWFNAAEKTVSDLSRESGARQQPQVISNTNFNIGIVDGQVMDSIILGEQKPRFTPSNFQNADEAADGDNLQVGNLLDRQLAKSNRINFVLSGNSNNNWTLSGRYEIKPEGITLRVSIKKNNEAQYRFEEQGALTELNELLKRIAEKAAEWVTTGK